MFQTKVVEKIKTHISCSVTSFPKIVHFTTYVIKHITARQAIDGNIIRRTHLAHWITKATDTHTHTHTHTHTQRERENM